MVSSLSSSSSSSSSSSLVHLRVQLEKELEELIVREAEIDNEVIEFFDAISTARPVSLQVIDTLSTSSTTSIRAGTGAGGVGVGLVTFTASASELSNSISTSVNNMDRFAPFFEAMIQDSKKLANQVEDCRKVSDRMSMIVRRLDNMQIRAQQALACTEDIINLKECKIRMLRLIEEGNLPQAVNIIKQIHDIDIEAAKSSDDYNSIQNIEKELSVLVSKEFTVAMEDGNIKSVMSLCPLLQTLGLESDARDQFLDFVDRTVFIGVSADITSTVGTTDPATGYAEVLSNIFNSTYLILQQYLPIVIQGMETSLGDVYFIRKLNSKCEAEAGILLKRYLKFRNVKGLIPSIGSNNANSNSSSSGSSTGGNDNNKTSAANLHVFLDELALLIQYCCSYSNYLKQVCYGAESIKRIKQPLGAAFTKVFTGQTDFDKMVDELINRYYLTGETYLLRLGIQSALTSGEEDESGLDECFFILQRCCQRAIATNNVQAACAVLHLASDLLSSDLLSKAVDMIDSVVPKISSALLLQMSKYTKGYSSGNSQMESLPTLSKGIKDASNIAMSFVTAARATTVSASNSSNVYTSNSIDGDGRDGDDQYGIASCMQVFNTIETCGRYVDRLSKDVKAASTNVFSNRNSTPTSSSSDESSTGTKQATSNSSSSWKTDQDWDKVKLCRDDFDSTVAAFTNILKTSIEALVGTTVKGIIKDVLVCLLNSSNSIKFDVADHKFDLQPSLSLYPKCLVAPFEVLIGVCIGNLSDGNRDIMISVLAEASSDKIEQFLSQLSFRFAGALKFEECIRAVISAFTKHSSVPIRSKFSRLKEILSVITADLSNSNSILTDSYSTLTINEVKAYMALRVDKDQ